MRLPGWLQRLIDRGDLQITLERPSRRTLGSGEPGEVLCAINLTQSPTAQALGDQPPTEHPLLVAGVNKTQKGNFLFDDRSAKEVMRRANEWGNDFHGDYHHDSVEREPGDPPAEATVWFNLEVRDGALYATKMRWVTDAAQRIREKKMRYFSNVFLWEPLSDEEKSKHPGVDGRIVEYVNLGLTNDPAANRIQPLVAAERPPTRTQEPPKMKALLARLGLTESASETEALGAFERFVAQGAAAQKAVDTLVAAAKERDPDVAAGKIAGLVDNGAVLRKKLAKYAKDKKLNKRKMKKKMLKRAMQEGRISKAQLKALSKKNSKFVTAFLQVCPPKGALPHGPKTRTDGKTSEPKQNAGDNVVVLSALDKQVASEVGITLEQYAASKAKGVRRETTAKPSDQERELAAERRETA